MPKCRDTGTVIKTDSEAVKVEALVKNLFVMKIDEVKDMLPQKPERMESVEEPKKSELVKASYDVIGCILEVYKQLGAGLPEYIYQEALAKQMVKQGG